MSKSPHRYRGDAAECWRAVLFGEIIRVLDVPVSVRADPTIRLPRSGHWESGLAQIRPALDDALGATAFAVAWRWACAERESNAWPGLPLVAAKATDRSVSVAPAFQACSECSAVMVESGAVVAWSIEGRPGDTSERLWRLSLVGSSSAIGVRGAGDRDWHEVDRIASIVAAWFDAPSEALVHLPPGVR